MKCRIWFKYLSPAAILLTEAYGGSNGYVNTLLR